MTSKVKFEFEEPPCVRDFGVTVWHEFSPMAAKYEAVNLGQGYPSWSPPGFVVDAAIQSISEKTGAKNVHQYARSAGHLRLVNILAKKYNKRFTQEINPLTDICVTAGASEGIYSAIQATVHPGDEVILVQPFFDIYIGAIAAAGGVARYISYKCKSDKPKSSSDFYIDLDELKSVMNEKTKVLLINSPHNPSGKVLSKEELQGIADVVASHPKCIVISDEVYEHLTFDGVEHHHIANMIPERTITVSSAGKLFSVTGWKLGWCMGPKNLLFAIQKVHQFVCFALSTPLQEAIAIALEKAEDEGHYTQLVEEYTTRRAKLYTALEKAGLNPIMPQGAFYILADISTLPLKEDEGRATLTGLCPERRDWRMTRRFTTDFGVTGIPCSAFFSDKDGEKPEHQRYVRFAFCKKLKDLDIAAERFGKMASAMKQ